MYKYHNNKNENGNGNDKRWGNISMGSHSFRIDFTSGGQTTPESGRYGPSLLKRKRKKEKEIKRKRKREDKEREREREREQQAECPPTQQGNQMQLKNQRKKFILWRS